MTIEEVYQVIWDTFLDYFGDYYKAVEKLRLVDITYLRIKDGAIDIHSRQIGQLIGHKSKLYDKLQSNLDLPLKIHEDESKVIADSIIKYGCPPDPWN